MPPPTTMRDEVCQRIFVSRQIVTKMRQRMSAVPRSGCFRMSSVGTAVSTAGMSEILQRARLGLADRRAGTSRAR